MACWAEKSWQTMLVCAGLVLGCFTVYWPVKDCGFVLLDDGDYVLHNEHVRGGLSLENLVWSLRARHAANWHPLTWWSHLLDCQLYGLTPAGHHLTNVAFHVANSLLVLGLLRQMTGALWRSALVAFLFALHPLRVESVAWISERKDMLSGFFFLLTLTAYASYVRRVESHKSEVEKSRLSRVWVFYALCLFLFACGLMSKPMLVTLPLVLLLLDYWPFQRWPLSEYPTQSAGQKEKTLSLKALQPLLVEKLPFFALSAGACVMTLWAQRGGGAVRTLIEFPTVVRTQTVLIGYVSYLGKMIWPADLMVLYPHPSGWAFWKVILAGLVICGITLWVFRARKTRRFLVMGWLWFLVTLMPVIGLVQVGTHFIADRYSYIPLIGLFICLAWLYGELGLRKPTRRLWLAIPVLLVLVPLGFQTYRQVQHWRNSVTLFEHALRVTLRCYDKDEVVGAAFTSLAHHNLGRALVAADQWEAGVAEYHRALNFKPNQLSRRDATIFQIQPDFAEIYDDLGETLALQGKWEAALESFLAARNFKPNDAMIHCHLAGCLVAQQRAAEAIDAYRVALRLKPDFPDALNNLAWILATHPDPRLRNGEEAIAAAQKACELTAHKRAVFVGTLAAAYAEAGRFEDAIAKAQMASALAETSGEKALARRNLELLEIYRAGKPWREDSY